MIHIIYGLVIFVHIIACIGLIAVILLQAGKGGGLTEAFGGVTQNLFGSKSNEVLVRATAVFAIVFLCTSLLLGILTSKRGRSLLNSQNIIEQVEQAQQKEKVPAIPERPIVPVTEAPQPLVANSDKAINKIDQKADVSGANVAEK